MRSFIISLLVLGEWSSSFGVYGSSLEALVEQEAGRTPSVLDSVGLGWGPRMYTSSKFSRKAPHAGLLTPH